MTDQQFMRTEMLLGQEKMKRLSACRVAVFGLGGVGGYAAEALARSGIGALDLIDPDAIALSNLNRQILALHSTLGVGKAEAAKDRIADIAPNCSVRIYPLFYLPDTADQLNFSDYDYIIDAIDTVTGKLTIAEKAKEAGTPLLSVMGTGNKLDPTKLTVADLYETEACPLAKVMRRECRKRGIEKLKVVYSTEKPIKPVKPAEEISEEGAPDPDARQKEEQESEGAKRRKDVPGSTAFVPGAAGLIAASVVIRELSGLS